MTTIDLAGGIAVVATAAAAVARGRGWWWVLNPTTCALGVVVAAAAVEDAVLLGHCWNVAAENIDYAAEAAAAVVVTEEGERSMTMTVPLLLLLERVQRTDPPPPPPHPPSPTCWRWCRRSSWVLVPLHAVRTRTGAMPTVVSFAWSSNADSDSVAVAVDADDEWGCCPHPRWKSSWHHRYHRRCIPHSLPQSGCTARDWYGRCHCRYCHPLSCLCGGGCHCRSRCYHHCCCCYCCHYYYC